MAKRGRKRRDRKDQNLKSPNNYGGYAGYGLFGSLKEETKNTAWAIGLFLLTAFLVLSAFNSAGPAGQFIYKQLNFLLGRGYFLLPISLILVAASFLRDSRPSFAKWRFLSGLIALLALLASAEIIYEGSGGLLGMVLARPLVSLFDVYISLIISASLVVISSLVLFDSHLTLQGRLFGWWLWGRPQDLNELDDEDEETINNLSVPGLTPEEKEAMAASQAALREKEPIINLPKNDKPGDLNGFITMPRRKGGAAFAPPPLSLLANDSGRPGVGDIKANANIIKRTLANFGITVEMDEVSIGPSITRYAFKPAEGVRLAKILTLQRDLELSLAAHPIRIEAPIPGKSLVGIELPNSAKTLVGLGSLLGSKEFTDGRDPLLISLGRGISGEPSFARLTKAPHLLIAGATGSGKSVTIHTVITSLLYRQPPDNLRFIMIDPKRVELTLYNRIPHLLTPVITDPKKAIMALRWAAGEMDRRYNILEQEAVRDIESYHKNVLATSKDEEKEGMPYIVVIIDELADIMSTYPRELEAAIVRLAQMSRAVGIHLIISTQRPSVEVITGLIKANIPSRIALQVASQIDSRTIIDMAGAEKLLGQGDMLYLGSEMGKPIRLQSAFISEDEVKKVTKYLAENYDEELPALDLSGPAAGDNPNALYSTALDGGDDDEMYEQARQAVMEAGKASASYLQRKLKVGYARAARLIDMLEERGVVGPGEGAKPREVRGANPTEGYGEMVE